MASIFGIWGLEFYRRLKIKDFLHNQVLEALFLVHQHLNSLVLDCRNLDFHLQKSIFEMDQNHCTLQDAEIDLFGQYTDDELLACTIAEHIVT